MVTVGLYARVSKKEQANDTHALDRQLRILRRQVGRLYPGAEVLEYIDVQSGRRDDRIEYSKLIVAVEAKALDVVVVLRIDRLTRDLETNARLAKMFERTGVQFYEIDSDRIIDFRNPNDWSYFVNAGVSADKETRKLSARIGRVFEDKRLNGQMAGGRVGWPYRMSPDGFIEVDPAQWDKAVQAIFICLEERGSTTRAMIRIRDELGMDRTRQWLHRWLRSPLLRGWMIRDTRVEGSRNQKRKIQDLTLEPSQHPSLFSDPRLLAVNAEERLEQTLKLAKTRTGRTHNFTPYPLSGLCICGRCGGAAIIKTLKKKGCDKTYCYIACSQRINRLGNCGGDYGTLRGVRNSVNTRYADAEAAVLEALAKRGKEIFDTAIAEQPDASLQDTVEINEIRDSISRLEALNDPDLRDVIDRKTARLNQLRAENKTGKTNLRDRELAMIYSSQALNQFITEAEKTFLFHKFVLSVSCDRGNIVVTLRV